MNTPPRAITEYPEKAKVIRLSELCLITGLLCWIPPLGLALHQKVLDLFIRVAAITGELWPWGRLSAIHVIVGLAAEELFRFVGGVWAAAWILLALLVQTLVVGIRYRTVRPTRWNPARGKLYAGIALAHGMGLLLGVGLCFLAAGGLRALLRQ